MNGVSNDVIRLSVLLERQGKVLALKVQRQLAHHLGGSIQSIPMQVFSTREDG